MWKHEQRRRKDVSPWTSTATVALITWRSRILETTKVELQNATGEWRTTIRDLNTLMANQIPSRNSVDINLRFDPYQTSTSTSFDNGTVGMPGTGYRTIDPLPDEPMHISPPTHAAEPELQEVDYDCQG